MDRLRGRELQIDPGFFLSQGLGSYFRFLALISESEPIVFFWRPNVPDPLIFTNLIVYSKEFSTCPSANLYYGFILLII